MIALVVGKLVREVAVLVGFALRVPAVAGCCMLVLSAGQVLLAVEPAWVRELRTGFAAAFSGRLDLVVVLSLEPVGRAVVDLGAGFALASALVPVAVLLGELAVLGNQVVGRDGE